MPEIALPVFKTCPGCFARKALEEFYRSVREMDGRGTYCKPCQNARVKANKARRKADPELRAADAIAACVRHKKNRLAKPELYGAILRRGQARYRAKHKERVKARWKVAYAVKIGRMPHPGTLLCRCGAPAAEYHHHLGYSTEHILDVVPLCGPCHDQA